MKDSFVFYKSWQDSLNLLPDSDSFKKVFNAICDFVFLKKEIEDTDFSAHELTIIKMGLPLLAASIANYENGMKGAKFGKLGGRPKKTHPPLENPLENPLKTPNDNVNENLNLNDTYNDKETVNLNDKETVNLNLNDNSLNDNIHKKNNRFYKPTLEQVESFCKDKNLGVNPEEFFEYYETTNWENVYNWQALIVAWNKRQIQTYNGFKPQTSKNPYEGIMEG